MLGGQVDTKAIIIGATPVGIFNASDTYPDTCPGFRTSAVVCLSDRSDNGDSQDLISFLLVFLAYLKYITV